MKYIDLAETIHQKTRYALVKPALILIRSVLQWLDEHPDQVPGRTMTESESGDLFKTARQGIAYWPDALKRTGITVVPDPEPTNAEKWDAIVDEWHKTVSPYPFSASFGEWMDSRGVKAPGVDDE